MTGIDPAAPTVAAVIVTYESEGEIRACLRSVVSQAGPSIDAFVVDNASSDTTRKIVMEEFPRASLMTMDRNRWYTAAANAGAARSTADYLLFLNPDAELTAGAVAELIAYVEGEPRCAAAGPRL